MMNSYFFEENDRFYVHEDFLVSCGIDRNTILSRVSESTHGKIKGWISNPKRDGKRKVNFIDLNSLSRTTISKYKIPDAATIKAKLTDLSFVNKALSETKRKEAYALFLQQALQHGHKFAPYYYKQGFSTEKIALYGKTCAVLMEAISIKKNDYGSVKLLWEILNEVEFKTLYLPLKSLKYFYEYLKEAERSDDVLRYVFNQLCNKPSNHKKRNHTVDDLIIYFKGHGNGISNKLVRKLLNALIIAFPSINKKKEISESCISETVRRHKHSINIRRKGSFYLDKNILPFQHLLKAENPLDVVYVDGYCLQVACKNELNQVVKYVVVFIQDGHSGRILGYAMGEAENSSLILEAFRMMLLTTGFKLPAEIITDGYSSYRSEALKRIETFTKEKLGATWDHSSNPQRKAVLERWFNALQRIHLSPHFGYIGEGIKSKNDDARPKEEVLILLRNPEYLKNFAQMKIMLDQIVVNYNKVPLREEDPSPIEKYHGRKPINAIDLGESLFYYLIGKKFTRKMQNMEVQLTYKQGTAFYKATSVEEASHNLTEIDCYMDYPHFTKYIYAFEKDSEKLIGIFKQVKFLPTAFINQTEEQRKELFANYKEREKLKKALIQQTKDLEDRVTEFFGRPPEELLTHIIDTKTTLEAMDIRSILNLQENSQPHEVSLFQNTKLKPLKKSKKAKKNSIIKSNSDYSAIGDMKQL